MAKCSAKYASVVNEMDYLGQIEVALGISAGVWRNGSASDSRSEGWEFDSLCPHISAPLVFLRPQVAINSQHSSDLRDRDRDRDRDRPTDRP